MISTLTLEEKLECTIEAMQDGIERNRTKVETNDLEKWLNGRCDGFEWCIKQLEQLLAEERLVK